MKPVRFASGVEAEIEAAGDYYEAQRAGLGAAFLEAIEEALERLAERPGAHGPAHDASSADIRQVLVRRFPYRVLFQERTGDLLVLACMHSRRKPGSWRSEAD